VGKPIANMMVQKGPGANSTVTVVHTRTKALDEHCKRADILIVAAGVPGLVKPEWIKPGACVIDVGVNRVGEKPSKKDPSKMVAILKGDVDFDAAKEIAGSITPVPGRRWPHDHHHVDEKYLEITQVSTGSRIRLNADLVLCCKGWRPINILIFRICLRISVNDSKVI
jgi:hypothetical protein